MQDHSEPTTGEVAMSEVEQMMMEDTRAQQATLDPPPKKAEKGVRINVANTTPNDDQPPALVEQDWSDNPYLYDISGPKK
jgi:hypothetical protein